MYYSSTGKVFLAWLYRERIAELIAESPPTQRTPLTQTTVATIRKEAVLTRKRGYSLDNEEFNPGVRCLATPVFGPDGRVIAALGITAATLRFTEFRIPEMATKVQSVAAELSQLMGHTEHHA